MSKRAAEMRPFLILVAVAVLVVAVALLLVVAAGCGGDGTSADQQAQGTATGADAPQAIFEKPSDSGSETSVLDLEVASTAAQRSRGLMERQSMEPDHGMVFVFPSPTRGAFWMKNTYIPLSIAFIDGEGKIVDIQDMEPLTETPHEPAAEYLYAVEVNQGYFADREIVVGDQVRFEGL